MTRKWKNPHDVTRGVLKPPPKPPKMGEIKLKLYKNRGARVNNWKHNSPWQDQVQSWLPADFRIFSGRLPSPYRHLERAGVGTPLADNKTTGHRRRYPSYENVTPKTKHCRTWTQNKWKDGVDRRRWAGWRSPVGGKAVAEEEGGRRGEIRNAQFPRGMGAPKSIDFGRMSMMLRNISSPGHDHSKERVGGNGEWPLIVVGGEYWKTEQILIKYFRSDLFQASIRLCLQWDLFAILPTKNNLIWGYDYYQTVKYLGPYTC